MDGPASAYPILSSPASICFSAPNDVFAAAPAGAEAVVGEHPATDATEADATVAAKARENALLLSNSVPQSTSPGYQWWVLSRGGTTRSTVLLSKILWVGSASPIQTLCGPGGRSWMISGSPLASAQCQAASSTVT